MRCLENFVLHCCLTWGIVCSPGTTDAEKIKAHGAMISVQAVFALWCIVGHIILADNDPLVFALARETISSGALLALAVGIEGEVKIHNRQDAMDIFLLVRILLLHNVGSASTFDVASTSLVFTRRIHVHAPSSTTKPL